MNGKVFVFVAAGFPATTPAFANLNVVASTPDGVEQRTIVIAIERNTKVLEPMVRESND